MWSFFTITFEAHRSMGHGPKASIFCASRRPTRRTHDSRIFTLVFCFQISRDRCHPGLGFKSVCSDELTSGICGGLALKGTRLFTLDDKKHAVGAGSYKENCIRFLCFNSPEKILRDLAAIECPHCAVVWHAHYCESLIDFIERLCVFVVIDERLR